MTMKSSMFMARIQTSTINKRCLYLPEFLLLLVSCVRLNKFYRPVWFFLFKDPHDLGVSWSYFVSSFLGRGLITIPRCSHCGNNNLIIDPCLWKGRIFSPCNWISSMSCQPQPERQILWKTFQVGIPGARCSPIWALFCLFFLMSP